VTRSLRADGGAVAVTIALALPMLFGFAALAIDGARLYSLRTELQTAANAAAVAAAHDLPDASAVQATAIVFGERAMPPARHGSVITAGAVETGHWAADARRFTAGGTPVNAVRVAARRTAAGGNPVELFIAPALGFDATDVSAHAVAARAGQSGSSVAMLALDPGQVTVNSGARLDLGDGSLAANSGSASAVRVNSGGQIFANRVITPGGIDAGAGSQISAEVLSDTDGYALPDACAGAVDPDPPGSCSNWSGGPNVDPGCYRNVNVSGNNNRLSPGTYYISGDMNFNSGSRISGDGVTLVLLNGNMNLNSGSRQEFSAPADTGVVVYKASSGAVNWNSGSRSRFEGVLYFPEAQVNVNGGAHVASTCTQLVGGSITLNSGARWDSRCAVPPACMPTDSGPGMGSGVALVE
jgi:hypothetical protein